LVIKENKHLQKKLKQKKTRKKPKKLKRIQQVHGGIPTTETDGTSNSKK